MEINKADSPGDQKFVPGMLEIVLVICIIDNTLQVTFIVPDDEFKRMNIPGFFHSLLFC
jgi:hypothetical protein